MTIFKKTRRSEPVIHISKTPTKTDLWSIVITYDGGVLFSGARFAGEDAALKAAEKWLATHPVSSTQPWSNTTSTSWRLS